MIIVSVLLVSCAIWKANLAQNEYNYDRPNPEFGSSITSRSSVVTNSGTYPTNSGFGSTPGTTTPTYHIIAPGYPVERPSSSSFSQPSSAGYPTTQLGVSGPSGSASYQGAQSDFTGADSFRSISGPADSLKHRSATGSTIPSQTTLRSGAVPIQRSSSIEPNEYGDYSAIPGEPGVDFPIYSSVPKTSFDCNQQQYPGYYADVDTQCQIFHVCALNKTFDFICPNGTIFSQDTYVCVWWNQFDCVSAVALYNKNADLYNNSQYNRPSLERTLIESRRGTGPEAPSYYATRPQSARPPSAPGGFTSNPFTSYATGPAVGYPSTNRLQESPVDGQFVSSPTTPTKKYIPPRQG